MKNISLLVLSALLLFACAESNKENVEDNSALQDSVNTYLESYNNELQRLYYDAALAEWELNTHIVEGDTTAEYEVKVASKAMADFTGSEENIETADKYLDQKDKLTPLQVKQLEAIKYSAAGNPSTLGSLIDDKIAAEAAQTKKLYGYKYTLNGKEVSTNEIDKVLASKKGLNEKLAAWEASKEIGKTLKTGIDTLRGLRNETVQPLGYDNFLHYQVSDYGMDVTEMRELLHKLINDIWPLYRELHTWTRHELANQYGKEVPEYLPAHWLPNRWGQEWNSIVDVEGFDLDGILAEKSAEWIVKTGEEFYMSIGLPALPEVFYEKSSLYPLPADADYMKNNHASAWHLNLDDDVRSLMSVEPNTKWWGTTLHELGHIYYYILYSNPDVPYILRGGANRAFHEGVGSMLGLAAMQKPFLQGRGLLPENVELDEIKLLLKEALEQVVLVPWGAGVMTEFEHSLYAENLPVDQFNSKWWEIKKKYQGIVPPNERGEEYCDPCTKTHINNDPAQYYDYALSIVTLFQLHDHIAKNILKQDPHNTNYWGSKETGDFLKKILSPGATADWRELMKDELGEEISAKAMLEYFDPLYDWLKEQNKGREHTLPESVEM
ncbi:MAG: M2 family metallopeptidase [Chlorobiota bacterium]